MIKLGSTDITNVMLGTTKVDAIFLGNTKVYPNLPAVEGVYVYHVDKKFYTFQQDATTAWLLNANADSYTTSPKRELNTALPVIKLG